MNRTIYTTMDDGIVTVWFDQPDRSVNTISPDTLVELSTVLDKIERGTIGDNRYVEQLPTGVIFASAKPNAFIAGADLFSISEMDDDQVERFLIDGQGLFTRIARLSIPTVAAINGDCLGGGYELALACDRRVSADSGAISIGLPEVKLGILPGWGGSTRLPRLIGLTKALPILLAGKTMPPRKARKLGMIDEMVRPEALQAAARRLVSAARKSSKSAKSFRRPKWSWIDRWAGKYGFVQRRIFNTAIKQIRQKTYGNYPAPARIIMVVRRGYRKGIEAGLSAERKSLIALTRTDACRNLMRLFFLRKQIKADMGKRFDVEPTTVRRAAVIGGGVMGAGIVHALITKGISVRLIEITPDTVAAALGRVSKMLKSSVREGKLSELEAKHAFNRVSPTTQWTGLGLVDLAVEAVVERMDIKHEVFAKLDRLTRPDCILASNTSSLSVAEMAKATTRPQKVVGLHFFNPVPKMPLVEVVRTKDSDAHALATAVALCQKLGKTPVVVGDGPGFLVNRVLVPYLAESLVLAGEGISIKSIDELMKTWGMPMGPFELLDQIGLDIGLHVLRSLADHLGDRIQLSGQMEEAIGHGWLGCKSGRGFYVYDTKSKGAKRGKAPQVHRAMVNLLAPKATRDAGGGGGEALDPKQERMIEDRLILPMINEAAYLLDEHIVDSPDTIDLSTVLGLGWAPFRGGLIHHANSIGSEKIVDRMKELEAEFGNRFAPAPLLKQMAAESRDFMDMAGTQSGDDSQDSSGDNFGDNSGGDSGGPQGSDTITTEVNHGQA